MVETGFPHHSDRVCLSVEVICHWHLDLICAWRWKVVEILGPKADTDLAVVAMAGGSRSDPTIASCLPLEACLAVSLMTEESRSIASCLLLEACLAVAVMVEKPRSLTTAGWFGCCWKPAWLQVAVMAEKSRNLTTAG